jgi:hypothetical protein
MKTARWSVMLVWFRYVTIPTVLAFRHMFLCGACVSYLSRQALAMDTLLPRLSVVLRWFAGLWLVGWTLYIVFEAENWTTRLDGVTTALAALLIPAFLAFGFSWALDRIARQNATGRDAALPGDSPKRPSGRA